MKFLMNLILYPTYNEELKQIWNKVQCMYYPSIPYPESSSEYILYSSQVFKTIPNNDDIIFEHISISDLIGDKIVFEFDSEEEALYFKLKYC